jgi:hypothetical protein
MNSLLISVAQLRRGAGLDQQGGDDVTEQEVDARIALALSVSDIGSAQTYASRAQGLFDHQSAKYATPRKPTDPHYMEGWNAAAAIAGGIPAGTKFSAVTE